MKHYRIILAIIFFLILLNVFLYSIAAHAAEINCYSGKTRIYHGYGNEFVLGDNFLGFTEKKSKQFIMIDADCILIPDNEGAEIDAIIEG